MSEAIQQIVDAYVRLNNRRALEDLRMHRQRMAVDLKSRTGFDLSLPIRQIDEEIAVIEAGLERLNSAPMPWADSRAAANSSFQKSLSTSCKAGSR
jgi:uncharacterized small protein (DUF1192 family)